MKFRLAINRQSRKSIMTPEYRTILDLESPITLSGTLEVLGTKMDNNGNLQIEIHSYFEETEEKRRRQKRKYNL